MATLRITVWLDSDAPPGKTPDTQAGRTTVYTASGTTPNGAGTGHIAGNQYARVPPIGENALDLNFPRIPGAISVSSYRPSTFDSSDLANQPSLVNQLAIFIEASKVRIEDEAALGVYLTRADLIAYL